MIGPTNDPDGSVAIAQWARTRAVRHEVRPDQRWYRQWEPHDTLVAPSCYLNACSWPARPGQIVLLEPWTEEGDIDPMERTILAMVSHPGLRYRAAMRSSESFITRVTFLTQAPPPTVQVGDPVWDQHVTTLAASPSEAAAAFHPELRALLAGWGFQGHIELRPGGAIIHYAGMLPIPDHYDRMSRIAPQVITAALRYPQY